MLTYELYDRRIVCHSKVRQSCVAGADTRAGIGISFGLTKSGDTFITGLSPHGTSSSLLLSSDTTIYEP